MPQTLLALLALTVASLYTLGQQRAAGHTVETVVRDEFELVVAGTLLHAMEFAGSRSFDQATTPAAIKQRLGLPDVPTVDDLRDVTVADLAGIGVADFAPPSAFGKDPTGAATNCVAVRPLSSTRCDDVSDLLSLNWQSLTLTTPTGDPLPVEVRFDVQYVEKDAPDTAVSTPTFHKRVEVWARSPVFTRTNPDFKVVLRRVVSYDPVSTLESLLRTAGRTTETLPAEPGACTAGMAALQAELATAQAAAQSAQQQAATAASVALTAQNDVAVRAAVVTAAQQALAAAQGPGTGQQAAVTSAATALAAAQTALTAANATLSTATSAAASAQTAYNTANTAYTAAASALASADASLQSAAASLVSAYATWDAMPDNNNGRRIQKQRYYDDTLVPAYYAYTAADQKKASAEGALQTAQASKTSAQNALTAANGTKTNAQTAVTNAQATLAARQAAYANAVAAQNTSLSSVTSAQSALTAAQSQLATAQASAAQASAAAQTAASAADAADRVLANAQAALDGAACV